MTKTTIAKYLTVETYGVYEREVEQYATTWETWAEYTQAGFELSVVCETPTGGVIVQHHRAGTKVDGFEALEQKAQDTEKLARKVASDKEDNKFLRDTLVTCVVGVIASPFLLYGLLSGGLLVYEVGANLYQGNPVLERTVFDKEYMKEINSVNDYDGY